LVIFDSAGGCGAFIFGIKQYDYRIADRDLKACEFLNQHFDPEKVFYTNSLIDVKRSKYSISPSAYLIMIGNPPYNDITSEFKNGEKGRNECDEDLFDRDLGISFLKSYYKLNANVVCVLHPLSYLIKEANFKRLRLFKDSYKLVKGNLFSSALFHGTGTAKFPIVIALYEKYLFGMSFDHVRQFSFDIYNSSNKFILSKYETSDEFIDKYPPSKNDVKESPIGLYYYTFRDFNSLKKNTSFMIEKHPNGIVMTLDNFYKYAYLYSLKSLFNPGDAWLYGNLSPLANRKEIEHNKKLYVSYALKKNRIFSKVNPSILGRIASFYNVAISDIDINNIEQIIKSRLDKLV
jgi:hypothetical protein